MGCTPRQVGWFIVLLQYWIEMLSVNISVEFFENISRWMYILQEVIIKWWGNITNQITFFNLKLLVLGIIFDSNLIPLQQKSDYYQFQIALSNMVNWWHIFLSLDLVQVVTLADLQATYTEAELAEAFGDEEGPPRLEFIEE
jgi:hypothetical protein